MKRRIFYSFHYDQDAWRAATVRNMGVVEGNRPATDNQWETIKAGGRAAIEGWINDQMHGTSCIVVLVGSGTAGRKWIKYEIEKAWNDGKGVVGIRIHGLKNENKQTSACGANPFDAFDIGGRKMSSVVKCYNPGGQDSQQRYAWIRNRLRAAIEEAIGIRNAYRGS